ncbi:hypothetical protein GZH53_17685 [Flavihumibacter sp. R14]|nr:hypothetical protein [Flavihumibacter soli]
MKIQITQPRLERSLKMLIAFLALMALYLSSNAQVIIPDKVNIGLIYPISTNGTHAAADTNLFSFNLLAGVSAAEKGFTFAGFSNVVRYDAKGMQFAGFSNHVGKKVEGMMFAGFINTYGEGKGVQFAGFTNIATNNVEGLQFSGFFSRAADVKGTQFAGFLNTSRDVVGTQIAGFSNVARNVKGTQIAGFTNTAGDVTGSQIAGFFNVAKKVKGVQIAAFINIADSSDHPIGLINIIRKGEKSIGFSIDESQTAVASFRSGGRILYGIIGGGYNFKNKDAVYALEAGFGAHMINTRVFRINTELSLLTLEDFWSGGYFKSSFKLMPSIRPSRHIELFGGPVFNYMITNTTEGQALTDNYIKTWENRWGNNFEAIYVGYTGGVNILF